jgi:hypothetical protein
VIAAVAGATEAVIAWIGPLPGPMAVACAAGPAEFGLARRWRRLGAVCVAPSKLERPPGDRVKTDRRDAEPVGPGRADSIMTGRHPVGIPLVRTGHVAPCR